MTIGGVMLALGALGLQLVILYYFVRWVVEAVLREHGLIEDNTRVDDVHQRVGHPLNRK